MEFLNFVMALSPIVVVLVGILAFHQSAKKVAPIALVWTLILAFTYFNVTGATFKENVATYDPLVWKGLKEGLKIVLMVFGAFVILNLLRETGAKILVTKDTGVSGGFAEMDTDTCVVYSFGGAKLNSGIKADLDIALVSSLIAISHDLFAGVLNAVHVNNKVLSRK